CNRCEPRSHGRPRNVSFPASPPIFEERSTIFVRKPRRARRSVAAIPAMPAPVTTKSRSCFAGALRDVFLASIGDRRPEVVVLDGGEGEELSDLDASEASDYEGDPTREGGGIGRRTSLRC